MKVFIFSWFHTLDSMMVTCFHPCTCTRIHNTHTHHYRRNTYIHTYTLTHVHATDVHLMTVLVKVYLIVIAAVAGSSMRIAWLASRPVDFVVAILMLFFMNVSLSSLGHCFLYISSCMFSLSLRLCEFCRRDPHFFS
jgi:hypothetical protein